MGKNAFIFVLLMTTGITYTQKNNAFSELIISLEKSALEKWNNGNPSGFLDLSADDVVYFDPMTEKRLNGKSELTALYENLRGKIHVDHYELIDPKVQATEKMAVLTYNLVSREKDVVYKWNCTEVYRLEPDGNWKIIQTHWSLTRPGLKMENPGFVMV